MNILITGIHGFVGSNLVAALCERHTIYGLDIVAPEKVGVVKTFSWDDFENGELNSTPSPLQGTPSMNRGRAFLIFLSYL